MTAASLSTLETRVRYPEVDRMGLAYHGSYLVWFEMGRTEYLRSRGQTYRELEERGLFFPLVEAACRYHHPARYDELVTVHTTGEVLSAVRVAFDYKITRQADTRLLATGRTVHAAVGAAGRPVRMPAALRRALEQGEPV